MRSIGQNPTEAQLQDMISEVERSTIDFHEFLSFVARKMKESDTEEELKQVLKKYDIEENGLISASNLRQAMFEYDKSITDEEIDEMIREVDVDEDG